MKIASSCSVGVAVEGVMVAPSEIDVSSSMGLLRDNGDFGFLLGPGEADEEGVK